MVLQEGIVAVATTVGQDYIRRTVQQLRDNVHKGCCQAVQAIVDNAKASPLASVVGIVTGEAAW